MCLGHFNPLFCCSLSSNDIQFFWPIWCSWKKTGSWASQCPHRSSNDLLSWSWLSFPILNPTLCIMVHPGFILTSTSNAYHMTLRMGKINRKVMVQVDIAHAVLIRCQKPFMWFQSGDQMMKTDILTSVKPCSMIFKVGTCPSLQKNPSDWPQSEATLPLPMANTPPTPCRTDSSSNHRKCLIQSKALSTWWV